MHLNRSTTTWASHSASAFRVSDHIYIYNGIDQMKLVGTFLIYNETIKFRNVKFLDGKAALFELNMYPYLSKLESAPAFQVDDKSSFLRSPLLSRSISLFYPSSTSDPSSPCPFLDLYHLIILRNR